MIRQIKRIWSDDELRPAIKLITGFVVVATIGIKVVASSSTLIESLFAAIVLSIPFAFTFTYVSALIRSRVARFKFMSSLGATTMILGAIVAFIAIKEINGMRMERQSYSLNAKHSNHSIEMAREDEVEDRTLLGSGIVLIGLLMIQGGYKLIFRSAYSQGQMGVRQE